MINNILLAIDFSEKSDIVFKYAIDLKNQCKSELIVLNVNEELLNKDEMIMSRVKVDEVMKSNEEIALHIKEQFNTMLANLNIQNSSDIKIILREGNASKEIIEYADTNDCDLIVIGSNAHSKITELLIGSTGQKIIDNSKIPILVVPLIN